MRLRLIACACVAAVLALSGSVAAQPLTDEQIEKAKKHFIDAQKAMEAKEYEIAAREYAIAYDITKDPTLFYWIGLARQEAGDCDGALIYYRRYVKEGNPQGELEQRTRAQIDECNKLLGRTGTGDTGATGTVDTTVPPVGDTGATDTGATDTGDTGATGTVDTTVPPVGDTSDTPMIPPTAGGGGAANFLDQEPSWKRTAGWIAVGATVAFATTGAVMGLSARSREEDIEVLIDFRDMNGQPRAYDGNTRATYDELIDEGERFDTLARISLGLAGASAVAATIFFVLDATGGDEAEGTASRLVPVVGPDGVGVAAGWEF
jgi:hypothetical protein